MNTARNDQQKPATLGYATKALEGLEEALKTEPVGVLAYYGCVHQQGNAVYNLVKEAVPPGKKRRKARIRINNAVQNFEGRFIESLAISLSLSANLSSDHRDKRPMRNALSPDKLGRREIKYKL